jgi:cytochrome c6
VTQKVHGSKQHVAGAKCLLLSLGFCLFLIPAVSNRLSAQENDKSPGATIFKTKCALCHGADGSGNTPLGKQLQAANLGSKEVQKKSNAEMHKIVHDGRANMPSFAEQLSDAEIDQVIRYIRHFGKAANRSAAVRK